MYFTQNMLTINHVDVWVGGAIIKEHIIIRSFLRIEYKGSCFVIILLQHSSQCFDNMETVVDLFVPVLLLKVHCVMHQNEVHSCSYTF